MVDAGTTPSCSRYQGGAIEIDAMLRRVLINGFPVKVGARAFDVLLALVERRDRVVPKRELMDLVWPNLVVEEGNLLVHMVALRKVLGARAISTIPGRGYRFVMPIDTVIDEGTAATAPIVGAVRGNVPASPALIGRTQDLDAIDRLLLQYPVVSIVGAGGIGKTRMALAAAAAPALAFLDGRWWVELASTNEGTQVPNSISRVLGIQLPAGRPPAEALASALANKNLLLVLDNCEHLADEIATLIDHLRAEAPKVSLLVTSQESLKCRDEQVYRLGALEVPSRAQLEEATEFGAVAMFVDRAHAVDSRFRLSNDNLDMVVDICRRLDGIPLAIELAAARVPVLGVHGLHARLNQMFNVLTGGTRMKLRRHQTLRAALEWSHGLLSAHEQTTFRRLGVFAGGFTLELGQQVVQDASIDQWLVLDLLGHLIDKSLVIADGEPEPRYHLLETTRAFALEQLGIANESEAMLRRHAEVMRDLMTATDANCWDLSPAERKRAVQELGNLRAAIDWAASASDEPKLLYELMGKCWLVWLHNGLTGEGVQRMLQQWPPAPDLPAVIEADFCLALARLNESAGREEHWQAARRAEALYRQLGNTDRLSDALLLIGTIGLSRNHLIEAERALHEAEQLVTDATALRKQAALAATQGECWGYLGENARSIAAFRRQLELYRRAGASLGEFIALGNVGSAHLQANEIDAAIESLSAAVDGLRRLNAPYALDFRLSMLSIALALRGDDVDVLALAREAFDQLRALGATSGPLLAAALHHARHDDLRRGLCLAGYATGVLRTKPAPVCLQLLLNVQQRVCELAAAEHDEVIVQTWLQSGEQLTESQAAAIAFNDAPLNDGLLLHANDDVGSLSDDRR